MAEMIEGLNLVLLGKIGAGKSASGNTILGRKAFLTSVTQNMAVESGTVCGQQVTVYDTPGLFNTKLGEKKIQQINANVLQECQSGRCVFLLVIEADRFTKTGREAVEKIEKLLGEKHLEKTLILFTKGDELEDENMTIDEFINGDETLKRVFQKYDQRYHVFNNKNNEKGPNGQVQKLLTKIEAIEKGAKPKGRSTEHEQQIPQMIKMLFGRLTRWICVRLHAPDKSHISRRIVLLGKTGAGKSAAGNTILGRKVFEDGYGPYTVTRKCSEAHSDISVSVVDTPGFIHTHMNTEQLVTEIARSVYLSSPGPHAFLIVLRADDRFTEQEELIPQMIEIMFGQEVLKYSIILFTHGDHLDGETVKELIECNSRLRDLVDQCGGRFHVFNNKDQNNRKQVNDLLQKIDTMIEQNRGGHYSNQMFEDAHRFRQEEERRQREEKERKRQEEKAINGRLTRWIPSRLHAPDESDTSRRIVLLGKTGAGKSAAGNTILRQKVFEYGYGPYTVTRKCSEAHPTDSDISVSVVDTPGFIHTHMNTEQLVTEIARSVYLSSPGPHAFLIVFRADDRFTEQEELIPQMIEIMFGQEVLKYSIILFTHGDHLDGETIKELIKCKSRFRDLVDQCGGRFHIFNNEDQNNRKQVNDLLQKIDTMIEQNGGGHYSNQMFEDALRSRRVEEEQRQREDERMRNETERRVRAEIEGPPRFLLERLKQMRQREEERKKQEEIERVIKEIEKGLRAKLYPFPFSGRTIMWRDEIEIQRQEETERVIKETEEKIREELEGPPRFISSHILMGWREGRERQQLKEIERVIKETGERIRAVYGPHRFILMQIYRTLIREIKEVRQRQRQEENQRQEEIERVRKETEEKIRAELEAERSELERLKVEIQGEEEERKRQEEKSRLEEIERVIEETVKRIRAGYGSPQIYHTILGQREEVRKLQEEKQRQEIERVRKETEEKIRAEFEAERSELERLKVEIQRENEVRKQLENKRRLEERARERREKRRAEQNMN